MTASAIHLRSPADILTVIPHLLGFHPDRSVVLVSLQGRRVGLTERVDLPQAIDVADASDRIIWPLLRDNPDSVLLIGYETDVGESLPILQQLTDALAERGIPIVDRMVVRAGQWRSLDCTSPDCCPPDGSPLPTPSESARVLAEFVGEGVVPLASRAGLEAMIEAGQSATTVAALIATDDHDPVEVKPHDGCDALAQAWIRLLDSATGSLAPAPEDVARVLTGLKDVQVRDAVVAALMPSSIAPDQLPDDLRPLADAISTASSFGIADPAAQRAVQSRLIALCQLSPDGHAAPPLTLLAVYSWWRGDGATARVALARALRCDPDYRLARLLDVMLDLAIRPPGG
jgi:hypothetical protein